MNIVLILFCFYNVFFKTELDIFLSYTGLSYEFPAVVDYNKDGISEIIFSLPAEGGMASYHIKTQEGQYIRQLNFPSGKVFFSSEIDIDKEGIKEFAFSYLNNDSLFLYLIDITTTRSWNYFITKVKDLRPPEGWMGSIDRNGVFCVDYKRRRLLVVFLAVGFDLYPRGFFVIDANTGEILWKFISGANPVFREIKDINGDDIPEIIVGTFAPNNGSDFGGFPDSASYFFIFNMEGEMLVKYKIGSRSTYAKFIIDDPDAEEIRNIYVAERGGLAIDERKERFIYLISGKTGEIIKRRKFYEGISRFESIDINLDGKKEFIVLLYSGKGYILDKTLNVLREFELGKNITFLKPQDLDFDGNEEIIVVRPGKLEVYDRNFKLLSEKDIGEFKRGGFNSTLFLTKGKIRSILLYSGIKSKKFVIYSFKYTKKFNFHIFIVPAIILIILGIFYSGFKIGKRLKMREGYANIDLTLFYESLHEIKNLLKDMSSFVLKQKDDRIIKTYTTMEEIVSFLKTYIILMKFKKQSVELNHIIEKVVEEFKKKAPEGIIFEKKLDDKVKKIKASAKQIEILMKNLIQNSIEAMDKGKIEIETVKRKRYVIIRVKDEGKGIDKEKIESIFNPFVTSKDEHLGLGLYVVKTIVDSHNGKIKVESNPGKGTIFEIILPLKD